MSAAPASRVTPIGPREIDAAREYFVGLHTRLERRLVVAGPRLGATPRRVAEAGG